MLLDVLTPGLDAADGTGCNKLQLVLQQQLV
jgi:hypothetical protein